MGLERKIVPLLAMAVGVTSAQAQLTVSSHTPDQNDLDITATSNIEATFSQNIDSTTLDDDVTFNVDGSMSGEHQGVPAEFMCTD